MLCIRCKSRLCNAANEGQGREVGTFRPVHGTAAVTLYEQDSLDPDDFLGRIEITEGEAGGGTRSQSFKREGAWYTLYYRVV
jgi:hypothetical protein